MNITQIFNAMKFDADKCGDCAYLRETKNAYGTGDSEYCFDCTLPSFRAEECWLAVRELNNLKEQLEDLQ